MRVVTREESVAARERCAEVFGEDHDLLGVCLAIRGGLNGSGDWPGYPANLHPDRTDKNWLETLTTCRDALDARLVVWHPTTLDRERDFDGAVRHLVSATVALLNMEIDAQET